MLKNQKEDNSKLLSDMKMEFEKQISKIENDYENLEQYNRRDNFEFMVSPRLLRRTQTRSLLKY